jgi:hypothetical protein
MNSLHQEDLDKGETVYLGVPDSVKSYPGNKRARFTWQINADPRIDRTVIYWNDGAGSVEVPVTRTQPGMMQMETVVDIPEGGYTFEFVTVDKHDNRSVGVEKYLEIYGERYIQSLRNRIIRSMFVYRDAGKPCLRITWEPVDDETVRHTAVTYSEFETLATKSTVVYNEDSETVLYGFAPDSIFVSSVFRPLDGIDDVSAVPRAYYPPESYPVGLWIFDDADDFTRPNTGQALTKAGDGFTAVDGPAGSTAVRVARGSYFEARHGIAANGGGTRVNEYSMMFDYRLVDLNDWYSLLEANLDQDESDIWIYAAGGQIACGDIGYSDGGAVPRDNSYHRIVMTVKLPGDVKFYMDGELVFTASSSLDHPQRSLDTAGVLLFADVTGWDADIDVAAVGIWDKELTAAEVAAIGGR